MSNLEELPTPWISGSVIKLKLRNKQQKSKGKRSYLKVKGQLNNTQSDVTKKFYIDPEMPFAKSIETILTMAFLSEYQITVCYDLHKPNNLQWMLHIDSTRPPGIGMITSFQLPDDQSDPFTRFEFGIKEEGTSMYFSPNSDGADALALLVASACMEGYPISAKLDNSVLRVLIPAVRS